MSRKHCGVCGSEEAATSWLKIWEGAGRGGMCVNNAGCSCVFMGGGATHVWYSREAATSWLEEYGLSGRASMYTR